MARQQYESLPELLRGYALEDIGRIRASALATAAWDWSIGGQARRSQRLPVGDWTFWLLLAGRGAGKSRALSGVARAWAMSGRYPVTAMIGATSDDTRNVLVEGPSGIMATTPRWERPILKKQDRKLVWPNGAITRLYSAEEPDRLRGANNYGILCDELAAWKYGQETWDQAMFGLRMGTRPRAVIATTPRPTPLVRKLASDPRTFLTTGSTHDNAANLAPSFLEELLSSYEGTRLGQQEVEGRILLDVDAAMWTSNAIRYGGSGEEFSQIVVAVDPTGSATGDECGIVVAGRVRGSGPSRFVVLDDTSISGSPDTWARRAAATFEKWRADLIVAEVNYGGDMVVSTMANASPNLPVRVVRATRGKAIRAQPVALLYEQGRVQHAVPFPQLEAQLCAFSEVHGYMGNGSPDRADALVWAIAALANIRQAPVAGVRAPGDTSKFIGVG